jgi:uncharacterized membrane protein YgcG
MKVFTILTFLAIIFATHAHSFPDFPNKPVLDVANALSSSQEEALNNRVINFEKKTSMQIRLVIEKDVSPYKSASAYAEDLYHHWKLGDKDKHNGLLLVIAQRIGSNSEDMKDYCRIMTGWGIVTIIPDSVVIEDIKYKHMIPRLPSQPYLAFDNSLDRIFQDVEKWKVQHPEDNTVKNESLPTGSEENIRSNVLTSANANVSTDAVVTVENQSEPNSEAGIWIEQNIGWLFLGTIGVFAGIGLIMWFCSDNTSATYYRSSGNSKKKSDSGCTSGSSGCSSGGGGCGSSGCGGGGCGGGGCSS